MVQAGIRGLAPHHAKETSFTVLRGLLPDGPGRGRTRVEWEAAALNRPEEGEAGDQGWPCWGRAEKGWGTYWPFLHGEKGRPASRTPCTSRKGGITSPGHPAFPPIRTGSRQPEDPAWTGRDEKRCHRGFQKFPSSACSAQKVRGHPGPALFEEAENLAPGRGQTMPRSAGDGRRCPRV